MDTATATKNGASKPGATASAVTPKPSSSRATSSTKSAGQVIFDRPGKPGADGTSPSTVFVGRNQPDRKAGVRLFYVDSADWTADGKPAEYDVYLMPKAQ